MRALVLLPWFLLSQISAHAFSTGAAAPAYNALPGGGWQAVPANGVGTGTRSWSSLGSGAATKFFASDGTVLAGRAGALGVTASQGIGLGDAALAVARCLLGANVICAAATAAATVYAGYRIYTDAGSLKVDPGADPVPQRAFMWYAGSLNHGYFGSVAAACGDWRATQVPVPGAASPPYTSTYTDVENYTENGCYLQRSFVATNTSTGVVTHTTANYGAPIQIQIASICQPSIDYSNPAYSIPGGAPIGPDGKCPTARYNHTPLTPEAASQVVVARPPASPDRLKQAVADAVDNDGKVVPSTISIQGPASQTGTPTVTTTTSPTGTSTETRTPTYNYSYYGDTITYNTSYVTVTNNGGSTTTVTTTPAPSGPQDPTDPCTQAPDRVGCLALGEVPDGAVPTSAKPVFADPQDGWGAGSGTCPAPKTITVLGIAIPIDNTLICSFASGIRPYVIGMAAVIAALIFIGGVKD